MKFNKKYKERTMKNIKAKCLYCGKEFIKSRGNQVLCSDECKKERNKEKAKESYQKNKDKIKQRNKKNYYTNKTPLFNITRTDLDIVKEQANKQEIEKINYYASEVKTYKMSAEDHEKIFNN